MSEEKPITENFLLEFVGNSDTPTDEYSVVLENISDNLYTDGVQYFEITESAVYLIEAKAKTKKKKKVKIARKKGSTLILSTKKDKIVFSPEVVVMNSTTKF